MKKINKLVLKCLLLLIMAGINPSVFAQTIGNPGFETGSLSPWSGTSAVTVAGGVTVLSWTVNPSGTKMAKIMPTGGLLKATAESNLGLSSGALVAYNSAIFTPATNFGTMTQTITLAAGQTVSAYWNYISQDYSPYNDGVIATLVGPSYQSIKVLSMTVNAQGSGAIVTGSYGSTDWHIVTFTAGAAGTYKLGFACFNSGDQAVDPILVIDDAAGGTSAPNAPIVTTSSISSTGCTTATCGGNVTSAGSSTVTARGVCWNTTGTPSIANPKTVDGSGTGSFTSNLTGLTAGVTYYVRSYATNTVGTSYGPEVTVTMPSGATISGTGNITTTTASGACSKTVTYSPTITGATSVSSTFSGATTGTTSGTGSGATFNKGTTTVTITATGGCGSSTASFTVTVNDNENPTITAPANVTVNANSGACNATGYDLGSATTADNCGVASVTNNDAGTYSVGTHNITWTVTDVNGNTATATQTITVVDNQNPTITAPANVTVNANSGACNATGYDLGSATTADNCGVASVTNNDAGSYSVGTHNITWTVTDVNGNTATATQTITVVDNQNPTITAPANVTVSANSGTCYATGFDLGSATTADNCGVASVSNDATSSYAVGTHNITWTVTDVNGNTATATQTITVEPNTLSVSATHTDVSCNASNGGDHSNGTITTTVSGGTGAYTYSWTGGATGANPTGLTTGVYTVTVSDDGCSAATPATTTVTISEPSAVSVTATATQPTCSYNTGSVSLASSGGTGSISYSGSATTGLTTGTYSYTATDANGCTSTASASITNPSAISFTATATQPTCSYNTGSVSLASSGGTGTITYTGAATTGLTTGTYGYTATDANGCTATTSATITNPSAVTISWSGSSPAYDAAQTYSVTSCPAYGSNYFVLYGYHTSLSATATGGTGTKTYTWSAGSSAVSTSGTAPCSYSVFATDANGCTSSSIYAGVVDVRCSTPGNATKTKMCRNNKTICVDNNAVEAQIASGATVGACGSWKEEGDINSVETTDAIKMYPNPTEGTFNVVIPATQGDAVISVSDVAGRVILTRVVTNNRGEALQLNISDVAKGVYFVRVNAGEISSVNKLIVR